jgi:hypothetical protein
MSVVFAQEALLLITEVPLLYREVPPLEMFHPMEQIVPPYGINCSTLWNKLFHPMEHPKSGIQRKGGTRLPEEEEPCAAMG